MNKALRHRYFFKALLAIAILFVFSGCLSLANNNQKTINLWEFEISTPVNWFYEPLEGIDAFVGQIKIDKKDTLFFENSSTGLADSLVESDESYLKREVFELADRFGDSFLKEGITYTNKENVQTLKAELMKKEGVTDSSLVKVQISPAEAVQRKYYKPNAQQKLKFPKADYIVQLTYHGKTDFEPVELPTKIKQVNVKHDTDKNYVYKTIWPKITGHGETGIYIHSRKSTYTFVMVAKNLSAQNQEDALKAFKTIRFKQ